MTARTLPARPRARETDPLRSARNLHARAVEEYAASRPGRSRALGRRALNELAGAPPGPDRDGLHARVLVSLSLAEAEVNGAAAARAIIEEAAVLADRLADRVLTVLVRSQRGALALREHDLQAAITEYAGALPALDAAPPFNQWVLLGNFAVAYLFTGDLRRARPLAERAIDVAGGAGLRREEAKARHNLGYLEFLAGDLPSALRQMAEARTISPDLPDGVGLLDRARVLAEAGLLREADSLLALAAETFARDRMTQDLGEVELQRAAGALAAGDIAAARRFAAAARTRFRKRGADRWRRSAELVLLQGDLAALRPGRRLTGPAARLQQEFAAAGLPQLARTAALIRAQAHLLADEPAAARAALTDVDPPARTDPITARLPDHYVRAQLDVASGDRTAATRRITRGLTELARYQASFGSLDLASAAAVHGRQLAGYGIELARRSGRAAEVFTAAERARAVTSRLAPVRPPDDPAAADLVAELRQTVEALRPVEQDRRAAAPLLARRAELERAVMARSWNTAGSGTIDRLSKLSDLRAQLAADTTTMLSFVQAGGRLSAVTVGRRLALYDIGAAGPIVEQVRRTRADLDVLAQPRLSGGIRAAVRSSLARSLDELDRLLVRPLAVDDPLVILSTGALGQLPWASLPSLRGRTMAVAPSATKWLSSRRPPDAGTRSASGSGVVTVVGPELGRGEVEARAVAAAWPGAQTIAGAAATTAAFVDAVARARVLHVAAHGVHQSQSPLFSNVLMADGPVFAHELDRTARAPEHVVLSACEVGLATVRPGDEALGLASALLHLGTRCVVASVARVNDAVAEATMTCYHRLLAAGADSATALAQALCEVDADVVPPFVAFGAAWHRD